MDKIEFRKDFINGLSEDENKLLIKKPIKKKPIVILIVILFILIVIFFFFLPMNVYRVCKGKTSYVLGGEQVIAHHRCTVSSILTSVKQRIKANQPIIYCHNLYDPADNLSYKFKMNQIKKKISFVANKLDALKINIKKYNINTNKQINLLINQNRINNIKIRLKKLEISRKKEQLEIIKKGTQLHIISKIQVSGYFSSLIQSREDLTQLEEQSIQIKREIADIKKIRDEKNNALLLEIFNQKNKHITLENTLEKYNRSASFTIRSNTNGIISSIFAKVGNIVHNSIIATVIPINEKINAVVYIPKEKMANIKIGDKAIIQYIPFPMQSYGTYKGRVSSISNITLDNRNLTTIDNSTPSYIIGLTLDSQFVKKGRKKIHLNSGIPLIAKIETSKDNLFNILKDKLTLSD